MRSILYAGALAAVIFVCRRQWSLVGISDSCALSGIVFLIAALFRMARYLRFYDLIIYGFQKFKQIWKNQDFLENASRNYGTFVESRQYEKNYRETFIAAVLFLCAAVVLGI